MRVVARTRESRPVRAHVSPFRRVAAATAFALALTWLVPSIGLTSRDAERAALALVAFGVATVALRRATIFEAELCCSEPRTCPSVSIPLGWIDSR